MSLYAPTGRLVRHHPTFVMDYTEPSDRRNVARLTRAFRKVWRAVPPDDRRAIIGYWDDSWGPFEIQVMDDWKDRVSPACVSVDGMVLSLHRTSIDPP